MTKNEVKIGSLYAAKVTNKVVQVRIDAESRYGGWDATNLATGKKVRIHSAQRLRAAVGGGTLATGTKKGRSLKDAKKAPEAHTAQTSASKGEGGAATTPGKDTKAKKLRAKKATAGKPKRMSGLDAAATVLAESGEPMTTKEMVEVAEQKGYWKSPGGKTPAQTLYSAIIREIAKKGDASRFTKTDRGKFTAKR